MADKMLDIIVDQKKLNNLQNKLSKYPPYAIEQGMKAVSDYLNELDMTEMYPPESDAPFQWSSDKQRKAYFASNGFGAGIPYSRTYELAESGKFTVHSGAGGPYSVISYSNSVPYAKFVIGLNIIIGLAKRGWKSVDKFVVSKSVNIGTAFRKGVKDTWNKMQDFMFGGGVGL